MSVLHLTTGSEQPPRGVVPDGVLDANGAAARERTLCSCSTTTLSSPAGEILVLRVAGEVDLTSIAVLRHAVSSALARGPCEILIDLAAMTFCDVRGLALLVDLDAVTAGQGIGYRVCAASRLACRVWAALWDAAELPARHRTVSDAVRAVLADQAAHLVPSAPPAPPAV